MTSNVAVHPDSRADLAALAALLARAETDIAAQRNAYGTEQDEDTAWRCAWNTWRTLKDLVPAVRALLDHTPPPVPTSVERAATVINFPTRDAA